MEGLIIVEKYAGLSLHAFSVPANARKLSQGIGRCDGGGRTGLAIKPISPLE
jgi:hypothetical protein